VVAVSGKDRSAIMLGGYLADAAYWMVGTDFVTSTYYRRELPGWVREFNAGGPARASLGKIWNRLLPASAYALAGPDDDPAERDEAGLGRSFPHPITSAAALDRSPFSNDILAEFAMRAVRAESLGQDTVPDLLAVAFSANDRVGHAYGPDSHEVLDVTVRLDRTLERLFGYLDRTVGLSNVVMVLTADHGVAPMPEVLRRLRPGAPARRIRPDSITAPVVRALDARYGPAGGAGWIAYHDFPHLNLNLGVLRSKRAAVAEAERIAAAAVASVPGVHEALTATDLARQRLEGVRTSAVLSFHPRRSPSVYYQLEPYLVVADGSAGAEHGSRWAYDQQVPVLWYGGSIRPGERHGRIEVADVAPTLSAILGVGAPGGSEGRVLQEMLR
jgi:Type I phosphodiesterase / nucleotide pyrophosphatase